MKDRHTSKTAPRRNQTQAARLLADVAALFLPLASGTKKEATAAADRDSTLAASPTP